MANNSTPAHRSTRSARWLDLARTHSEFYRDAFGCRPDRDMVNRLGERELESRLNRVCEELERQEAARRVLD